MMMMEEDGGLGAARALLFNDQHQAMGKQAEEERILLEPNMQEMSQLTAQNKKQERKKSSAGIGFGASTTTTSSSSTTTAPRRRLSKIEEETQWYASAVRENGVVLVPGVLTKELTAALRDCVVSELELMRDAIRADPSLSVPLFYVPADIHFSTPRGYVLLPLRDTPSVRAGPETIGPIVQASRELLSPQKPLSGLFGELCDGNASQMYDFCALRTEPGAARQVVHCDTPHQDIPGLFCAFIALQDVTFEMGGTLFIPKTHTKTAARKQFDNNNERETMLRQAKSQYTMLKAGDAAVFDMRILHAGLANLKDGGSQRFLMAITFRNLQANGDLGHKPNLRPGYVGKYTLETFQNELNSDTPFVHAGNGMEPGVGQGLLC